MGIWQIACLSKKRAWMARKNGKATVGWKNRFHAQNARRLNDGTKKYQADHFVTKVQNDSAVQKKVLLAEKAEYDKIMRRKGAK